MPEPRKPELIEQTLLPGSQSDSQSIEPTDTPAHPAAHDVTVKPQPPLFSHPQVHSNPSVTEADMTRTPLSGSASDLDATVVPQVASRTGVPDKTVGNSLPTAPLSTSGVTGTHVGRFALKGLHARGGLGEVFTARDTELNREVAIKRIQSRYADDAASRRRFLTEAEITARLDHPGVVPVFGLVSDGFGRPCYAMRFIRGETLKDEIERYHGKGRKLGEPDTQENPPKPKEEVEAQPRSVAFRHLLQRFIAVCQAIAYAHTRKVIHRDIKPANVMVGSFGETLVVDWGLAKALDDGPDPEKLLKAVAAAGFRRDPEATELPDHMTLAGTAVGTPAYMSPEQASGSIELVGPPADVYGLGATLFAVLTGKAPFSGDITETLAKVCRGEFPPPKEVNPEVPAPLDAICCKAMSLRIEDRYPTALELAEDVERWLSDEPVTCYRDPFVSRLARWSRRHPARVAAGVSLALAGAFAGAAIAWAVSVEQKKTHEALVAVERAQEDTATEMKRALTAEATANNNFAALKVQEKRTEEQRNRAEAARKLAEKRFQAAADAFNTVVFDIQRQLADRAGNQDLRKNLLEKAQLGLKNLLESGENEEKHGADRTLVAAFRQMGEVYKLLGKTREARAEFEQAVRMAVEVLASARERHSAEDEWDAKQELGLSNIKLADIQLQSGNAALAKRTCESARDLLQQTLALRPNDRRGRENLALAQDQLGDISIERGETVAATEQCRAALELRRQLAADAAADSNSQRNLADSLDQYAEILLRSGQSLQARKKADECLGIRKAIRALLPQQPDVARELAAAHSRIGEICLDRNELKASAAAFEECRKLLDALHQEDRRSAGIELELAACQGQLSAVALERGDISIALALAEESNRACKAAKDADVESIRASRAYATSLAGLADVLLARGDAAAALASYGQSGSLLEPIQLSDPESVLAKLGFAHALERIGACQRQAGNATEAIAFLNRSESIRKDVLARAGKGEAGGTASTIRELALGLGLLADAYRDAKQFARAREAAAEEIALLQQLLAADGTNVPVRRELALATGKWAEIAADVGKPTVALIALQQSLHQLQKLAEADRENGHAEADLAGGYERLADLYIRVGPADSATTTAKVALDIRTSLAKAARETKASRRNMAISMIRFADAFAVSCQFALARKWYAEAREIVDRASEDPRTAKAFRTAEEKLALLDAIVQLTNDPAGGLAGVPQALHVPALSLATDWLVKSKRTALAGAIAWKLANTAASPEERYKAAVALARCASTPKIADKARLSYLEDAIKALDLASAAGFRDAELLAAPEWDVCREMPAFQRVAEQIAAKASMK